MSLPVKSRIIYSRIATGVLAVMFAAATLPGFWFMAKTLSVTDEPYQALNAMEPASQPLAPLSAWLFHAFGETVSYNLLDMRLFAWSWHILAVALGIVAVYILCRKVNMSLAAGVLAMLLLSLCHFSERYFGWSTFSAAAMAATFISLLCYMRRPDGATAAIVGLACSFATLLRLPSAVVFIVVAAMLVFYRPAFPFPRSMRATHGAIIAGAGVASFILVISLIYGSLPEYFAAISQNGMGGHSLGHYLAGFKGQAITALPIFLLSMGIAGLLTVIFRDATRKWLRLMWMGVLFVTSYYAFRNLAPFEFGRTIFNVSFFILEVCLLWMMRREPMGFRHTAMWAVFGLSLSAAAGSNTGLGEIVVFAFIPTVLYFLKPQLHCKPLAFTVLMVGIFACWFSFRHNQQENIVHTYPVHIRGCERIEGIQADAKLGLPVQKAVDLFTPYARDSAYNCFVVRDNNDYIYEYIFGRRNPVMKHYWDTLPLMDVPAYASAVEHMIDTASAPAAVLLVSSRGSKAEPALVRDMKERYRTVYADTTFTIIIKD